MFRSLRLAASMILSITCIGCGLFSSTSTLNGPTVSLVLQNDTDIAVCDVRVRAPGSNEWSENLLDPGDFVGASHERTFRIARGRYDVQLQACDDGGVVYLQRIAVLEEESWLHFRALEYGRRPRRPNRGYANVSPGDAQL